MVNAKGYCWIRGSTRLGAPSIRRTPPAQVGRTTLVEGSRRSPATPFHTPGLGAGELGLPELVHHPATLRSRPVLLHRHLQVILDLCNIGRNGPTLGTYPDLANRGPVPLEVPDALDLASDLDLHVIPLRLLRVEHSQLPRSRGSAGGAEVRVLSAWEAALDEARLG